MKKIKQLRKLILLSPEAKARIIGGYRCTLNIPTHDAGPDTPPYDPAPYPPADPTGCGCGCSGCVWEDGGGGFSVGMMSANIDGYDCTFFAIR